LFIAFRVRLWRFLAIFVAIAVALPTFAILAKTRPADSPKTVYLTFDDGPSPVTPRLLAVLKKHNVRATFFVTGQYEESFPVLKQISDDGHVIALHTYSHDFGEIYASPEAFWDDISKLDDLILETTGRRAHRILRFPGGSSNTVSFKYGGRGIMGTLVRQCGEKGIGYCDWTIDPKDAEGTKSASSICSRVMDRIDDAPTAVVLMHDGPQQTTAPEAADAILTRLKEKGGYTFDTIDHLIDTVHHELP
jgi:peptidoglycan/xylan/chitin deacetylase (PgdA/CDA1 family)